MRVLIDALYLTNKHLRGIGRYTQTLCRLIDRTHVAQLHVLVCSLDARKLSYLKMHLQGINYRIVLLPIPGRYLPILRAKHDLYAILCRLFRINLLHVPYETFYRTRIPNLMTVHGMEPFSHNKRDLFFRNFRHTLIRSTESVQHYIAVSSMVKEEIIRYLPMKRERVFEVPIPLDDSFFARRPEAHDHSELRLFYYGGFEENKNLRRLVEVLDRFYQEKRTAFTLNIAGDNRWHSEKMEGFLHRPYLRLLGYLDHNKLISEILASSCVILPSIYEGFGLPLVESLSLSTPVLSSRNVGAAHYVHQGLLCFDPLNTEDIIRALIEYCDGRSRIHRAAERQSINLRKTLSFQNIALRLKEAYLSTLKDW